MLAAGPQTPSLVEIEPDGRMMTVYFRGGTPEFCNAALYSLAIRVPLDPPFSP